MASWTLVPCLVALREEFNALSPKRDKTSDGAIGDTAHSSSSSDHNPDETGTTPTEDADSINEVHAIDVDNTGPWPDGVTMERCVQEIVSRHRSGADNRLQNVIYNRRIWSRSWGWTQSAYNGANPHDHHAHFSSRYSTAQENDVSPWGIRDLGEDMTPEQAAQLNRIEKTLADIPRQVGAYAIPVAGTDDGKGNEIKRPRDVIWSWIDKNLVQLGQLARAADVDEALLADLVVQKVTAFLPIGSGGTPVSTEQLVTAIRQAINGPALP